MKSTLRLFSFALALAFTLAALAAPGDLDPLDPSFPGIYVLATVPQPDGKMIIAGGFTSALGVSRHNIARLNADGTLDMGFDPTANKPVTSVVVQPDGKILLGGFFTTLQPNGAASPIRRHGIARVNPDGTLDAGFDPKSNGDLRCVAVQPDGKVLLGGVFTTLQPNGAASPIRRHGVARVNADGTLDMGFDPNPDKYLHTLVLQADGKVLLGGDFATLQPNGAGMAIPRRAIARVNVDGALDTSFNPNPRSDHWDPIVFTVATQADGKVLFGGIFATLRSNGATMDAKRSHIARVNVDGTLDTDFDPKADNSVLCMAVQADGKVVLGGEFTTLQPNGAATAIARQHIARINADGTIDAGFDPKADNIVQAVALQADGKVLLGGEFTTLQPNGAGAPTQRHHFARLQNEPLR